MCENTHKTKWKEEKITYSTKCSNFCKKNSVKLNWEYCIKKWDEMKIENLGKNKSKW